jgi:hypothetical protein
MNAHTPYYKPEEATRTTRIYIVLPQAKRNTKRRGKIIYSFMVRFIL